MVNPIVYLLSMLLNLYSLILIIWIVLSWLIAFGIVNPHQPFVARLNEALFCLTEPVLRRIRRFIPPMGMVDLSPIVLFIGIEFLDYTLRYYFG